MVCFVITTTDCTLNLISGQLKCVGAQLYYLIVCVRVVKWLIWQSSTNRWAGKVRVNISTVLSVSSFLSNTSFSASVRAICLSSYLSLSLTNIILSLSLNNWAFTLRLMPESCWPAVTCRHLSPWTFSIHTVKTSLRHQATRGVCETSLGQTESTVTRKERDWVTWAGWPSSPKKQSKMKSCRGEGCQVRWISSVFSQPFFLSFCVSTSHSVCQKKQTHNNIPFLHSCNSTTLFFL